MNKIKRIAIYILNIPLFLISKLIIKDNNIWIFGAWFGEKYADNSKHLFEYIKEYHPEIRAIWLTRNRNILELLESKGYEVYFNYSFNAILLGLQAKYSIFVQSNMSDSMLFLNNKQTYLIQLWHGIPLKKIEKDIDKYKQTNSIKLKIKNLFFPFLDEYYNLITASSTEDKLKFQSAFKNNNVCITGYPRNDKLFKTYNNDKIIYITYLPTYRDNRGDEIDLFSDYSFELEAWDNKLSKLSAKLNIKMHPVNKPKDELIKKYSKFKNINFLDEIDITEFLVKTDILITDYSSVYFDYLLMDSPIIFAPFDYKKYIKKDRELYYDFDEVTPGPKCYDWMEVLGWVEKFIIDPTTFSIERESIKNRFFKYQDNNNCKRVYEKIIELDTKCINEVLSNE